MMRPSRVGTVRLEPMPVSCLMASSRLPFERSHNESRRQIASRSEFATSPPLPSCAKTSRARPEIGSTLTLTCMLPKGVDWRMRRLGMISGRRTGVGSGIASSGWVWPTGGLSLAFSAIGCISRQPSR